ncbi:SGNH/GDSL hydrolase family protein [Aquabacter spiritensis]|uniref:Lysophospholipase L1-like esterase n=1 Tax=Aquabacter spiritensis TaxID=933073 RepID=A0A4R3LWW8_9HYPH|nr:SGNH/GDSL hydrolase family protein [Aquabacter spiritensis]TCT05110.1 lysophospholipase L1-like esterase [Aquabacter spiritensis]
MRRARSTPHARVRRAVTRVAALLLLAGLAAPASAQDTAACPAGSGGSLRTPRAAEALAKRHALTIVAIGSSSTVGVGASSGARAYPAVLEALLRQRFPGAEIRVVNRGGNGEDVPENLSRFERDVRDPKPDLVLWQVGTNYVLRSFGLGTVGAQMRQGIDLIHSWGADVVLIDLQYSPWVNGDADTPGMNALIAATAREGKASAFSRYALMKGWAERAGVPMSRMIIFDGLHLTDWSYDCFARALAASLIPALGGKAN